MKQANTDESASVDLLYAREDFVPFGGGLGMNKAQRAAIKVLIVDDNKDAADLLSDVLQFYGYTTLIAYSGREALEVIERMKPGVGILDLGMPDMTGLQLVRRLKAAQGNEHMLLIALTGWHQREVRASTLKAGFDFHFVKPADPAAISALIDEELFRRAVGTDQF